MLTQLLHKPFGSPSMSFMDEELSQVGKPLKNYVITITMAGIFVRILVALSQNGIFCRIFQVWLTALAYVYWVLTIEAT